MDKKKNHVSWGETPHLNKQLKNMVLREQNLIS